MKVLLAAVSRPEALDAQLRRHRPDAVVAICSEIQALAAARAAWPDIHWRCVPLGDAARGALAPQDDLARCAAAAREGLAAARGLLEGDGVLVVDLTGGTRPMAFALWMACPEEEPCLLAGGSQGAASRPQRVSDPRPARLALAQAARLIRSGDFCAAAALAEEVHARFKDRESLDPHLQRRIATTRAVASALARWDLCDYDGAARALKFDTRKVLPPDAHPGLVPALAALRRWLEHIRAPRLASLDPQGAPLPLDIPAFAHDCVLSARRLAARGAFDLAVLKLYRALEAALQAEFARLLEGRSNANVPVRLLPPLCRAAWEAENQTANLGLERTLRILEALGSPLAERLAAGFEGRPRFERGPVSFRTQHHRNRGPLAHGFAPAAESDYRECLEELEGVLGEPDVEAPDWGRLGACLEY